MLKKLYKCSKCKKELKDGEQPCPYCGHIGRDITEVINETMNISENVVTATEKLKRDYRWLVATIIVTIASPFIPAFLDRILGIIIGLAFGIAAIWLGKKAFVLVK